MAPPDSRTRVAVIGCGAAGMAAAWSLSRHPDKFTVDVYDSNSQPGGVAMTEDMQTEFNGRTVKFKSNTGVQGGALTYNNTFMLHQQAAAANAVKQAGNTDGDSTAQLNKSMHAPVAMTVSFGLKSAGTNWTNYLPKHTNGKLIQHSQYDIKKFYYLLLLMHYLEFIFIFLPTHLVLRLFMFSHDFTNHMIYPLTALFFGTGNQTPHISSALLSRVFLDPELRLFEYDTERLLSSQPQMFAFANLADIYKRLQQVTEQSGSVKFHFDTKVQSVARHSPYSIVTAQSVGNLAAEPLTKQYNQIIFACNTTEIIRTVGSKHLTIAESVVLNNVRWYTDITYTHTDHKYMEEFYTVNNDHRTDNYYTHSHSSKPELLEMSFNLTNYQPQLQALKAKLGNKFNVYQTIYLNKQQEQHWNIGKLDKSKVLGATTWYQMSHTWRHFLFTVPLMRFLNKYSGQQGDASVLYAGSWTVFNTHEIAVISGLAAAHRLGAPYPFSGNKLANKQFDMYLTMAHGVDASGHTSVAQRVLTMVLLPMLLVGHLVINIMKIR